MHLLDTSLLALLTHLGKRKPLDISRPTLNPEQNHLQSYSRLFRALSSGYLSISKDQGSTSSLGNLIQCLTLLIVQIFSLDLVGISLVATGVHLLLPYHYACPKRVCLIHSHPLLSYAAVVYRAIRMAGEERQVL